MRDVFMLLQVWVPIVGAAIVLKADCRRFPIFGHQKLDGGYCAVHKFGHFSLKFDYSLFSTSKTRKTEKTFVMPRKATKAVPPRAASDRTHTVSQKIKPTRQ